MKTSAMMLFFFSFKLLAQSAQYQMKGSFSHPQTGKSNEFTMRWSENNGRIKGQYDDSNHKSSTHVVGANGDDSRIFRVDFGSGAEGVSALTFITGENVPGQNGAKIPVSIVIQDTKGVPMASQLNTANLVALGEVQKQEEANCNEGFGALSGFCGVYQGMISESVDTAKKCNLTDGINPSVRMDLEGNIELLTGPVSNLVASPVHRIGRITTNPSSKRVDLMSRECRPLSGTQFAADNCKRINLVGRFEKKADKKRFTGTYTIVDEKTNGRCGYQLSLAQASE